MIRNSRLFLTILISGAASMGFIGAYGEIDYIDYAFYLDGADPTSRIDDGGTICNNVVDLSPNGIGQPRVNIVFSKKPDGYYGFQESAKIGIRLVNWNTNNDRTEFICATARSQAEPDGIKIILIETSPDSNYFQILGYLRLHGLESDDYAFGPDLKVNPDGDMLTVKFMDDYKRQVRINSGPWTEDGEMEGARGSTVTYSPSLFPDGTAEINCSAGFGGDSTDGDYICNNWETGGANRLTITFNGATYTGPPCGGTGQDTCPVSNIKDIFVEVDAWSGYDDAALTTAMDNVKTAFRCGASPLRACSVYPDVRLHVELSDTDLTEDNVAGGGGLSIPAEFNTIKTNHYAAETAADVQKSQVFHYALFVETIQNEQGPPGASGAGETWGNDMVIALGGTAYDEDSADQIKGTFMHELGHNLNLWHGGNVATNCKPNYLSVMNYLFQLPDMLTNRPLDYSQSALQTLVENDLIETSGVSASTPSGRWTVFGPADMGSFRTAQTGTGIDWDGSGGQLESGNNDSDWPVGGTQTVDINDLNLPGCELTPSDTQTGFKDWATTAIKYNARNSGNFEPGAYQSSPISHELNSADVITMRELRISFIQNEVAKSTISNSSKTQLTSELSDVKQLIAQDELIPALDSLKSIKNNLSNYTNNNDTEKMKFSNLIEDVRFSLKKATGYTSIKIGSSHPSVGDHVSVSVRDPDANLNPGIEDSIIVKVYSETDPAGIDLSMPETAPDTGIFEIDLVFDLVSDQMLHKLGVIEEDAIIATYQDNFMASAQISPDI